MSKRKNDRERREQQRLERLGTNNPICPCCGETDSRCFESHHIAGRKYDPTKTPLCLNDHAKVTDDQKDHPEKIAGEPHPLERIGRFLLGLADLLALTVKKLREFGTYLIEEARKAVSPVAVRGRT